MEQPASDISITFLFLLSLENNGDDDSKHLRDATCQALF